MTPTRLHCRQLRISAGVPREELRMFASPRGLFALPQRQGQKQILQICLSENPMPLPACRRTLTSGGRSRACGSSLFAAI